VETVATRTYDTRLISWTAPSAALTSPPEKPMRIEPGHDEMPPTSGALYG
jgi:hypothetical protein